MRISDWSSDVCSSDLAAVREVWSFQDDSDIGAGLAAYKQLIITANTAGQVYALDARTGRKVWAFQTGGKVYSTPAVWKGYVVVGSTDRHIYGLDARTGVQRWEYTTEKAVRSEEHTSELQSLMRISYAVFCLKKKKQHKQKIDR